LFLFTVVEPLNDVTDMYKYDGGQMMFSNPAFSKGGEDDTVDLGMDDHLKTFSDI